MIPSMAKLWNYKVSQKNEEDHYNLSPCKWESNSLSSFNNFLKICFITIFTAYAITKSQCDAWLGEIDCENRVKSDTMERFVSGIIAVAVPFE